VLDCEVVGKSILTTVSLTFKLRTCTQAAVTTPILEAKRDQGQCLTILCVDGNEGSRCIPINAQPTRKIAQNRCPLGIPVMVNIDSGRTPNGVRELARWLWGKYSDRQGEIVRSEAEARPPRAVAAQGCSMVRLTFHQSHFGILRFQLSFQSAVC